MSNAKIQMPNETSAQFPMSKHKCQIKSKGLNVKTSEHLKHFGPPICHLTFCIHLNFEIWHLSLRGVFLVLIERPQISREILGRPFSHSGF